MDGPPSEQTPLLNFRRRDEIAVQISIEALEESIPADPETSESSLRNLIHQSLADLEADDLSKSVLSLIVFFRLDPTGKLPSDSLKSAAIEEWTELQSKCSGPEELRSCLWRSFNLSSSSDIQICCM